jgi:hypothetical protein
MMRLGMATKNPNKIRYQRFRNQNQNVLPENLKSHPQRSQRSQGCPGRPLLPVVPFLSPQKSQGCPGRPLLPVVPFLGPQKSQGCPGRPLLPVVPFLSLCHLGSPWRKLLPMLLTPPRTSTWLGCQ